MFRSPELFKQFPELVAAESTRHGGVSPAPYSSLNLGGSTADSADNIEENRRRFWQALHISASQVASSHQVHGSEVLVVTRPGRFEGYDALVTNQSNIVLAVTVADCTPILIYDPVRKAVAAIHAGWRGTVQQIAIKAIQKMQEEYGTNPADCYAYIGTCIDECSFEVGEEVAAHFDGEHKRYDSQLQKYFVDLKATNLNQLRQTGLPKNYIEISAYSTVLHNDDYYSYRLEKGLTGRLLAVVGLCNR
ncbi:peptidoglycan editing factor PgeF [Telluribacter humicola]|uniref:peptidoglycan editing factor PgeF n=1 Tax=Telluribacter humicola TaxID=1720261 RepID=UPI001E5C7F03|nr:peptidoglycan editing factor PgeF [Telluribacter humicola]